jgi:tetratricopeptide (TPR) repeat protein
MKKRIGARETNLHKVGNILWDMGKDELDEKYFDRLLKKLPRDDPSRSSLYQDLAKLALHRREYDKSLKWNQKLFEFEKQNRLTAVLRKYVGEFIERKLISVN